MSVILGKRLRSDPGAKPVRQRTEATGVLNNEDNLTRLTRLFSKVPRDYLARVLESVDHNFEVAVDRIKAFDQECPEAQGLVDRCASASSLPEAKAIAEASLRQYHDTKRQPRDQGDGERQAEAFLRENAVLKKAVRFLHEKLLAHAREVEENEMLRKELERERHTNAALRFHLERC